MIFILLISDDKLCHIQLIFSTGFGTEFTQKGYFFLSSVTVYSKCHFLVHCCYPKLRIWVLFGITEIQCSYYLNKFTCHFHSRLSFSFTIGDTQLWFSSGYLCSLGRKKGIIRTCWRVCCLQQNIHRTTVCLGIFSFSPKTQTLSVKLFT